MQYLYPHTMFTILWNALERVIIGCYSSVINRAGSSFQINFFFVKKMIFPLSSLGYGNSGPQHIRVSENRVGKDMSIVVNLLTPLGFLLSIHIDYLYTLCPQDKHRFLKGHYLLGKKMYNYKIYQINVDPKLTVLNTNS